MAADAIAREARMIKESGYPAVGLVTVFASIARGNMIKRLACRLKSVVTRRTTAGYRRVIHESNGLPCGSRVAIDAGASSNDMVGRFLRRLNHAVR